MEWAIKTVAVWRWWMWLSQSTVR